MDFGDKKNCGKTCGKSEKILMFQREMSEEGSEPGALRGYAAVCHGHGHWGGFLHGSG